jgi:integrase
MATNGRLRDYLTKDEVRALLCATKKSTRFGARNYAMILLAYRHGFRASELVELHSRRLPCRIRLFHLPRPFLVVSEISARAQSRRRGEMARCFYQQVAKAVPVLGPIATITRYTCLTSRGKDAQLRPTTRVHPRFVVAKPGAQPSTTSASSPVRIRQRDQPEHPSCHSEAALPCRPGPRSR